jgi:hypothetical protein
MLALAALPDVFEPENISKYGQNIDMLTVLCYTPDWCDVYASEVAKGNSYETLRVFDGFNNWAVGGCGSGLPCTGPPTVFLRGGHHP